MAPSLTVLMTVYHGTAVAELERSVDCIVGQTRPPEELLVVVDGPVDPGLDAVLDRAAAAYPCVRVERLPHNVGSGLASARGLALATGDFVARHDADDISVPERLERELAAIKEQGLDIVGSAMTEFTGSPDHVLGTRGAPLTHGEIVARARINNPINNPTSVFRRELAVSVGGYADLRYMQDYDLFARMLVAGARAANLPESLVQFNAGEGMLGRRAGRHMLHWEWVLQRRLRDAGLVSTPVMVRNLALRSAFRLMPRRLMATVYDRLFREGAR